MFAACKRDMGEVCRFPSVAVMRAHAHMMRCIAWYWRDRSEEAREEMEISRQRYIDECRKDEFAP